MGRPLTAYVGIERSLSRAAPQRGPLARIGRAADLVDLFTLGAFFRIAIGEPIETHREKS